MYSKEVNSSLIPRLSSQLPLLILGEAEKKEETLCLHRGVEVGDEVR